MLSVGADIWEEAPAAFAFGVGADFDGGGERLRHARLRIRVNYAARSASARWIMDSKRALSCCF